MKAPDWYNLIAKERGMPEGWQWFQLDAIHDGTLVTGAACNVVFKRGPRKGTPNWDKRDRTTEAKLSIAVAEISERMLLWERETGQCSRCGGDGQELAGWCVAEGHKTRTCGRCDGSGKAPA
jgi:hypothetical protein